MGLLRMKRVIRVIRVMIIWVETVFSFVILDIRSSRCTIVFEIINMLYTYIHTYIHKHIYTQKNIDKETTREYEFERVWVRERDNLLNLIALTVLIRVTLRERARARERERNYTWLTKTPWDTSSSMGRTHGERDWIIRIALIALTKKESARGRERGDRYLVDQDALWHIEFNGRSPWLTFPALTLSKCFPTISRIIALICTYCYTTSYIHIDSERAVCVCLWMLRIC